MNYLGINPMILDWTSLKMALPSMLKEKNKKTKKTHQKLISHVLKINHQIESRIWRMMTPLK